MYIVAGDIMGFAAAATADDVIDVEALLSGLSRASSDSGDDDRWLNDDKSGDTQRITAPPLRLAAEAADTDGTTRQATAM